MKHLIPQRARDVHREVLSVVLPGMLKLRSMKCTNSRQSSKSPVLIDFGVFFPAIFHAEVELLWLAARLNKALFRRNFRSLSSFYISKQNRIERIFRPKPDSVSTVSLSRSDMACHL